MLAYDLPQPLQHEFERVAQLLYERDSTQKALIEAVELWLNEHRKKLAQAEARINNQEFEATKTDLEAQYRGKWVMIAHGKLQGVADLPETLHELAPTALHRIVVQMGQTRPQQVELGWQMTFA